MDEWAAEHPSTKVFAQIGDGKFLPRACQWKRILSSEEFESRCREAEVVVAHAGIGTVLTVLQLCRPLVILARQAAHREVTTNHQVATTVRFGGIDGITVANDVEQLWHVLETKSYHAGSHAIPPYASPQLIDRVRSFIHSS
jgi:UDP-N-acetylglucosamine transferase subunit ALG13